MIYFDNGATTPVCNSAAKAALEAMKESFGNPSSIHKVGQAAKAIEESARKRLASLAKGFTPSEVIFTSSGTEANNLAISGVLKRLARRGGRVCLSSTEHASVTAVFKEWADFFEIAYFEPDSDGRITKEEIESKIDENTVFVSLMLINNETGAKNDLFAVKPALEKVGAKAVVHSDCVAAFGKTELPSSREADLISVSGHKINAAKGVGALFASKDVLLKPLTVGGGQEKGLRSGTENVPAIASLEAAIEEHFKDLSAIKAHYDELFYYALSGLYDIGGVCSNTCDNSSHAVLNISVIGIPSEVLVRFLQDRDIYLSPASACSSNKGGHSTVLKAMRLSPERQKSAVRISFGMQNTKDEIDKLCCAVSDAVEYFKKKH
ncbi:MAG: cysteine desulfurase [Clostridia bacterium]|nr:cysteine desulfurase [Clostridia bacterium]